MTQAFGWRHLGLVAVVGVAWALYYDRLAWLAAGSLGFPYDDAWIHAQFARNLVEGRGFSYSDGRAVAGSTAPGWTLLLAAGYALAQHMVLASKGLGILLQIGTGLVAALLTYSLTGAAVAATAAGVVVVSVPAMVWGGVGGMEVPLAAFLVLTGLYLYLRNGDDWRSRIAAVAVLALSCTARPENLVVLAIVAAHFVLTSAGIRPAILRLGVTVATTVAILGPMVAFDYATIGRPLPSTFYAKSGPGIMRALSERDAAMATRALTTHGPIAVAKFGEILFDQWSYGALAVPVGLAACLMPPLRRRGVWLAVIVLVVAPFAMGAISPQRLKPDNVRYAAQLVCVAVVVGVLGAWMLLKNRAPWVQWTAALGLAALASVRAEAQAPFYALAVKNIQELQVEAGRWVCDHLPQGSTLAVNDIGALAYFGRHSIVDLEGLVTPEALDYRGPGRGGRFAEVAKPDYIAVFPSWHPDFMQAPERFEEIHRVRIFDNYIAGDSVIVVYRTPWTRLPPIRNPVPAAHPCHGRV